MINGKKSVLTALYQVRLPLCTETRLLTNNLNAFPRSGRTQPGILRRHASCRAPRHEETMLSGPCRIASSLSDQRLHKVLATRETGLGLPFVIRVGSYADAWGNRWAFFFHRANVESPACSVHELPLSFLIPCMPDIAGSCLQPVHRSSVSRCPGRSSSATYRSRRDDLGFEGSRKDPARKRHPACGWPALNTTIVGALALWRDYSATQDFKAGNPKPVNRTILSRRTTTA